MTSAPMPRDPSYRMSTVPHPSDEPTRLRALVQQAAQFGHFTLASGKTSDFYFDGRLVTLHPEGMWLVARAIHRLVPDEWGITAVGGPTLGADPIAAASALVGYREFDRHWSAFLVRKEAKQHGAAKQVEGPPLSDDSRVIVVEDTVTSGGSVLRALKPIEATGATVVHVVALLDREEGAVDAFAEAGYPFTALLRRSELG